MNSLPVLLERERRELLFRIFPVNLQHIRPKLGGLSFNGGGSEQSQYFSFSKIFLNLNTAFVGGSVNLHVDVAASLEKLQAEFIELEQLIS